MILGKAECYMMATMETEYKSHFPTWWLGTNLILFILPGNKT